MKNRSVGITKSLIASLLLSSILIVLLSGCVNRPLLLRNRPNVPAPVVEPTDGDTLIAVSEVDIIESEPPIISIPETLPPPDIKTAPVTYTVEKGDSFWKIARMYGVSKEELALSNNLALDKPLKIGAVILIPPGGEFVPAENRPPIKKSTTKNTEPKRIENPEVDYTPSNEDGTYTVKQGDSLWKIARRFKVKTALLAKANNLDIRKPLQIGQTLVIPGAGPTDPPPIEDVDNNDNKIDDVVEDPTDVIDDDTSTTEADDLLDDAVNSTKEPDSDDKGPTNNATDVIDDLDAAVKVAEETEIPGSLYTEEVLPNETLQDIADRHGLTPEQIRAVNPGIPADGKLKPFTSIKIPNK